MLGVVVGNKNRRFPVFYCHRASLQLLQKRLPLITLHNRTMADEYKLNEIQGHTVPDTCFYFTEYYLLRFPIFYAYCLMNTGVAV